MVILRDYQERISEEAAVLLRLKRIAYLSMECRTGKTITALVAAHKYGCSRVLFLTKKKAIQSVMADYEALRSSNAVSFDLDVFNYESAHKAKEGRYDLCILDEAHSLGAYPKPSNKTKLTKQLCKGKPIIFCSGTPTPESYSQLFHQMWVSDFSPWKQYSSFYKWAKVYVMVKQKMIGGTMHNDYSSARKQLIDETTAFLFRSYSQIDAGFSTNIVERTLKVRMSDVTFEYIKTMHKDRVIQVGGHDVLGDTPAKLMSKLHQLSSGTIIAEDGEHLTIDTSKADYIRREFAGQKIAVFYVYQSEADLLHAAFPNWTDDPEKFQTSTDLVFVCQVRRAREGVRLDSADALIFFNLEYSYLSYEQGRNRLVSKEREAPANVYFLVSDCGIEGHIMKAVHSKQDFTLSYYAKNKKYAP